MSLKNITPKMQSNNVPTAYNVYASSYRTDGISEAYKAFDSTVSTAWTSLAGKTEAWLELWCDTQMAVDYIQLTTTNTLMTPKKILVYGSNDRVTYTLIHTISNIAQTDYPLLFRIPRSSYNSYRLSFPESNNSSTSVYDFFYKLNEVTFYEDLNYKGVSERIKNAVINKIQTNDLIPKIITAEIE